MPIRIPVDAHIVTLRVEERTITSNWTPLLVGRLVGMAKDIWISGANIDFFVRSCPTSESPLTLPGFGGSELVNREGYFFLVGQYPARNGVSLILVNRVSRGDLAGEATRTQNACLVAWTTAIEAATNTLAHEFGHLLELHHINRPDNPNADPTREINNLMYSGLRAGNSLTAEQITTARSSRLARQFGGS